MNSSASAFLKKVAQPNLLKPSLAGQILSFVPTNSAQLEIWSSLILDQNATLCYNEAIVLEFSEQLDAELLQQAIYLTVKKHPSLRSSFTADGQIQIIHALDDNNIDRFTLCTYAATDQQSLDHYLHEVTTAEAQTPFNLAQGSLLRCHLIQQNNDIFTKSYLVLGTHHIVCDGWSFQNLITDLGNYYGDLCLGKTVSVTTDQHIHPFPITSEANDYWKKEVINCKSSFSLSETNQRPYYRTFNSNRLDITLPANLAKAVYQALGKYRLSLYSYMSGVFNLALAQSRQTDKTALGLTLAAQSRHQHLESQIGHYVQLLPLILDIKTQDSLSTYLQKYSDQLFAVTNNSEISYHQIIQLAENLLRDPSTTPLTSVVFNLDQLAKKTDTFGGISYQRSTVPRKYENFELFVNLVKNDRNNLTFEIQYNTDIFSDQEIQKLFDKYFNILELDSQSKISHLSDIVKVSAILPQIPQPEIVNLKTADPALVAEIQNIWQKVLKISPTDNLDIRNKNFFSLGGHSLLALEISAQVEKTFKIHWTIRDVFLNPTINQQAEILSLKMRTTEPTKKQETVSLQPAAMTFNGSNLTSNQLQIIFQEKIDPSLTVYNLPAAIEISGPFDFNTFKMSLQALIKRHDSLRTYFEFSNGTIQQKIENDLLFDNIEQVQCDESDVNSLLQGYSIETFDKTVAPLMKSKVLVTSNKKTILYFNFHHIIWDGWSFDIFFEELNEAYIQLSRENEVIWNSVPEKNYLDYYQHQENYLKSDAFTKSINYWKDLFKDSVPRLDLPIDFKRSEKMSSKADSVSISFTDDLHRQLVDFSKNNSVSVNTVLQTAFKLSLARLSSSNDIVIGIPVRSRTEECWQRTLGFFVNTLPIRTQLSENQTFKDYLSEVQNQTLMAFEHQDLPFYHLNKEILKDTRHKSLFQAFFSFQDISNRDAKFNNNTYKQLNTSSLSSHTDLDLWVKFSKDKMEGAFNYRTDLFKKITVERFLDLFLHTLSEGLNHTDQLIKDFSLPQKHIDLLVNDWGQGDQFNKPLISVIEKFNLHKQLHPDKLAVECKNISLTYSDLNIVIDKISAYLQHRGLKKGQRVGVCLHRSAYLPAVIMAIFKSGLIYVPLDPAFPEERISYIIGAADLNLVITEPELKDSLFRNTENLAYLDDLARLSFNSHSQSSVSIKPSDTAYIIFTSGSTGLPKGVEISHQSLNNFMSSMADYNICSNNDYLLAITTISFDISILELILPLTVGAQVYVADKMEILSVTELNQLIEAKKINVMQATPSTLKILTNQSWKPAVSNFKILSGGERLSTELAQELLSNSFELYNMYGPTETTIWSSLQQITGSDSITVGRPIHQTQLLILDQNKNLAPLGTSGELYIGGDGVAVGYYHNSKLTTEKFTSSIPGFLGQKFFATGDLAKWSSDGQMTILGRNDRQVKIRGYRIELLEVQLQLQKLLYFNDVHTFIAFDKDEPLLVAAVQTKENVQISALDINNELAKKLPYYMLPQKYLFLKEFPKTANNKIDESELNKKIHEQQSPILTNEIVIKELNNQDQKIEQIRKIWEKHLNIDDLQNTDNFFNKGGHSLIALNIALEIENSLKLKFPLSQLIETSTFIEFCDTLLLQKNKQVLTVSPQNLKSLVVLQRDGTETPLVCFHAAGGHVLNYIQLLDTQRSAYGFQTAALDGKSIQKQTIEEMAADYIDELKRVQPQGPYLLCGGSMGGMIALEVAFQLIKSGDTIEKIILFDTFGPEIDLKTYVNPNDNTPMKRFISKARHKLSKLKTIFRINFYKALKKTVPTDLLFHSIAQKNYQALLRYRPGIYPADIYLIRAKRTTQGIYSDPFMGWKSYVHGHIYVHEISASHESFIESENFKKTFAAILQKK